MSVASTRYLQSALPRNLKLKIGSQVPARKGGSSSCFICISIHSNVNKLSQVKKGEMDPSKFQIKRYRTRQATPSDAEYILSLAARVQAALTASGSLQELTPSTLDTIRASIHNEEFLIFTSTKSTSPVHLSPIGSVAISPFSPSSGHGSGSWGVDEICGETWYLHSLMLEPSLQGNGLGKDFVKEAVKILGQRHGAGTLVLDCWAGNKKLREFYDEVGFGLVGIFPEEEYEIAVFKIQVGAC
ncbi:hypothetical protein DL98DRAFT_572633 [Cadophora sp. DSE1049]|nr:hypothetical protein DL98DRAFT_572633 [Cadophora sp. DSE1049]